VDDSTDARASRRRHDPLEKGRRPLPEAKPPGRGPALCTVDDDVDCADRVGERLLVGIRVQLDDRYLGGQRTRNVIAKKFSGSDDEMHGASD
jgi:hypothetical protein